MNIQEIKARRARLGMPTVTASIVRLPAVEAPPQPEPEPQPVAPDWVQAALAAYREIETPQTRPNARKIARQVAEAHGLTFDILCGPSHRQAICLVRHKAIVAVVDARPDLSLPQIGEIFGGRDHTTVLNSIMRMVISENRTIRGWTPEQAKARVKRHKERSRRHHQEIVWPRVIAMRAAE